MRHFELMWALGSRLHLLKLMFFKLNKVRVRRAVIKGMYLFRTMKCETSPTIMLKLTICHSCDVNLFLTTQ